MPGQTQDAAAIEAEIEELQRTLGADQDAKKIVKNHIQLLHCYNETKDATQMLIGKLASMRQITVRELHEEYSLTAED